MTFIYPIDSNKAHPLPLTPDYKSSLLRAPLMPKGWPSAIAPPCGLTKSASSLTPSCRRQAMPSEAKPKRDDAIQACFFKSGLLRFARNDERDTQQQDIRG